jgi:hypothetical protein
LGAEREEATSPSTAAVLCPRAMWQPLQAHQTTHTLICICPKPFTTTGKHSSYSQAWRTETRVKICRLLRSLLSPLTPASLPSTAHTAQSTATATTRQPWQRLPKALRTLPLTPLPRLPNHLAASARVSRPHPPPPLPPPPPPQRSATPCWTHRTSRRCAEPTRKPRVTPIASCKTS